MEPQKSRRGGPRPNSGGARPGAGRPKNPPVLVSSDETQTKDPKRFLESVMADVSVDVKIRLDAAKALIMAEARAAEGKGKKEQRQEAAEKVAARFAPSAPPKLKAVS